MITLIAAVDESYGIGKNGSIPWHSFEDMNFFKNETIGGVVIMGSVTWESLKRVPLPFRINIVVGLSYLGSPQTDTNLCFMPTIESAVSLAKEWRSRIYGIGGTKIYEAMLPLADRMLLSRIPGNQGCDTFFPLFDSQEWLSTELSFPSLKVTEYLRKAK